MCAGGKERSLGKTGSWGVERTLSCSGIKLFPLQWKLSSNENLSFSQEWWPQQALTTFQQVPTLWCPLPLTPSHWTQAINTWDWGIQTTSMCIVYCERSSKWARAVAGMIFTLAIALISFTTMFFEVWKGKRLSRLSHSSLLHLFGST